MSIREDKAEWVPKTNLGRKVFNGEVTSISDVLRSTRTIREPEIVDMLVPGLEDEVVLVGGTPGKGGGKRRVLSRRTNRMHKACRRFSSKVLVIVGNKNGVISIAQAGASETRTALDKAVRQAKLDVIEIRRGCGSWECGCKTPHSIPFKVTGKSGSVSVELIPAPKGIGLAVSDSVKKMMRLAGVKDVWMKSWGKTKTRENLIKATYQALRKLNKVNLADRTVDSTGVVKGVC